MFYLWNVYDLMSSWKYENSEYNWFSALFELAILLYLLCYQKWYGLRFFEYRNALITTPCDKSCTQLMTSNIYMIIKSYKSCKVLTCTVLCGLSELFQKTGFNYLVRQINEDKVEENYFCLHFSSTLASNIFWT